MAKHVNSISASSRGRGCRGLGITILLLTVTILFPSTANAVLVENLYRAEVPVVDTSQGARDEAVQQGLREILVRVTGSRAVLQRENIDELVDDASRLVDSYSYREGDDELFLQVRMSASEVSRELAARDIAVWGANRPSTLVWFIVSDRTGRELINREQRPSGLLDEEAQPIESGQDAVAENGWKKQLQEQAQRRGVPVRLPYFDETDRQIVGLSELWGLFRQPIEEASARYAPNRIAVVRVSERGGEWRATWQLGRPGEGAARSGELSGVSEQELVADLIDEWAEHFSGLFAVAPAEIGDSQRLDMIVDGVDSMASYAAVRRALQAMEPVRSAELGGVRGDQLRLRLQFSGDVAVLREYVALDQRLRPVSEAIGVQEPERFDPLPSRWNLDRDEAGSVAENDDERFGGLYPELRYEWKTGDETDEELEAVEDPEGEDALELMEVDGDELGF